MPGTSFFLTLASLATGALINGWLTRSAAKKVPKTTERAKAYEAYVMAVLKGEEPSSDVLARIMVYGESEVIHAISEGYTLPAIIVEMRRSLETNPHVKGELAKIIASHKSKTRKYGDVKDEMDTPLVASITSSPTMLSGS